MTASPEGSGAAPAFGSPIDSTGTPRPAPARRWLSQWAALLVALLIFAVLSARLSLVKSMWYDEYLTWSRTGASLSDTIDNAYFRSTKPPVYFLLVHLWRVFGSSIEWIRLVSAGAILGSLVALHKLSGVLGIGRNWRSVALLAALTPHFIYISAEARAYAVCLFFLCWAMFLWAKVWVAASPRPGWTTVGFVAMCYLAMLTFYYSGFVVAGFLAAALLAPGRRWYAVRAGIALLVLFIPWLPLVLFQIGVQRTYQPPLAAETLTWWQTVSTTGIAIGEVVRDAVFRLSPLGSRVEFKLGLGAALVALVALRLTGPRPRWSRAETQVAGLALVGIAGVLAVRVANKTNADVRHWVVIVPSLLVLVALVTSRLAAGFGRLGAAGLVAVFAATAVSFTRNELGSYDYRSAARWISQHERPDEPIVIFDFKPDPFRYYYRGRNLVREIPENQRTRLGQGRFEFTPIEIRRLNAFLRRAAPPSRTFWAVQQYQPGPRLPPPSVTIDRYLRDSVAIIEQKELHKARVFRMKLIAPADSAATPAGPGS